MRNNLRPSKFSEFIGQTRLKNTIKVLIKSASKQKKTLDHVLLFSKPGLGKTTLATVLANESKAKIHYAQGPLLEKKSDVLMLFGSIARGDFIFIDEIHGINKSIEELLYSIIEDFVIDISVGPEGDQRMVRVKVPQFTLVGATTKSNKLSRPLRDRFGLIAKLTNYTTDDIYKIVEQSAKKLKIDIDASSIDLIANHAKENPRLANNILKRVIDFSIANNTPITAKIVNKTFRSLGIYKWGLDDSHIQYLSTLEFRLNGKYVSIETISGILFETKDAIENEIESDVLKYDLIEKNTRGRRITDEGKSFLKSIGIKNNNISH